MNFIFSNYENTVIGIDEVGRGSLISDVFIVGSFLQQLNPKYSNKVQDSKILKQATRREIFHSICQEKLPFALAFATIQEIEKHNIFRANLMAIKRLSNAIANKIKNHDTNNSDKNCYNIAHNQNKFYSENKQIKQEKDSNNFVNLSMSKVSYDLENNKFNENSFHEAFCYFGNKKFMKQDFYDEECKKIANSIDLLNIEIDFDHNVIFFGDWEEHCKEIKKITYENTDVLQNNNNENQCDISFLSSKDLIPSYGKKIIQMTDMKMNKHLDKKHTNQKDLFTEELQKTQKNIHKNEEDDDCKNITSISKQQKFDSSKLTDINIDFSLQKSTSSTVKDIRNIIFMIDGNAIPEIENKDNLFNIKMLPFVKGDKYFYNIGISAIIAKELRDFYILNHLHNKYPTYAWNSNMGYCTKAHQEAMNQEGICQLHRPSFVKKWNNTKNN